MFHLISCIIIPRCKWYGLNEIICKCGCFYLTSLSPSSALLAFTTGKSQVAEQFSVDGCWKCLRTVWLVSGICELFFLFCSNNFLWKMQLDVWSCSRVSWTGLRLWIIAYTCSPHPENGGYLQKSEHGAIWSYTFFSMHKYITKQYKLTFLV